jgi:magnesium chelatase subunit D
MSADLALDAVVADRMATGGIVLCAGAGPARDRWLARLKESLPADVPFLRLPPGITPDRLLGGMDLGATLGAGRPVVRRGLLSDVHGGILVVPMAERLPDGVVAALVEALDTGSVRLEREGASAVHPASFVPIFLDESEADEPGVAPALVDRVGPVVELPPSWRPPGEEPGFDPGSEGSPPPAAATASPPDPPSPTPTPSLPADAQQAVVETAAALGIASLRPTLRTLRVARALARARGEDHVDEAVLGQAAALVLGPRATVLPPLPEEPPAPPPEAPEPPDPATGEEEQGEAGALADRVLEAVRPSLPAGLLSSLAVAEAARNAAASSGRSGEERRQPRHGRTAGSRPGDPRRGGKVDLLGTLRAAAPWQAVRRRMEETATSTPAPERLRVRRDDLRIRVLVRKASTTAIFLVDSSGSQALNRLAEAKGAVELLLAESYVRRDAVALIAFRGTGAEVILPPTRALARARNALAGLPGGGGTPLASGVEAGLILAQRVRSEGSAPVLVLLTDGRANVGRDGLGGRERAESDAQAACRAVKAAGIPALFVDSSPRGAPAARELASLMGARYLRLPTSDPGALSGAVRDVGGTR